MGEILNQLPAVTENIESLGGAFSVEQIMGQIGAYFNGLLATLKGMIPAPVMDIYNTHTVLLLLAVACILVLIAFEGYRFFRMFTYAGGAFLFGLVGYWYLAPALAEYIKPIIPEIMDYYALVAVICALIVVILCRVAFNFVVFLIGGVAGYFIGASFVYDLLVSYFNTLDFLKSDNVKYIVGGVCAVILALAFAVMFKFLFMATTAFGGSIGAAIVLRTILVPGGDDNVKICFAVLGAALGIFAIIRQKKEEDAIIFRF